MSALAIRTAFFRHNRRWIFHAATLDPGLPGQRVQPAAGVRAAVGESVKGPVLTATIQHRRGRSGVPNPHGSPGPAQLRHAVSSMYRLDPSKDQPRIGGRLGPADAEKFWRKCPYKFLLHSGVQRDGFRSMACGWFPSAGGWLQNRNNRNGRPTGPE
jgi:hypothetical protein